MQHNIRKLRTIMEHARANQPLDPEQLAWLADGVECFLTRKSGSLDEAFGLCVGRGGIPWWIEEAIRIRDDALRELAAMICPDERPTVRARKIRQLAMRYAASAWRFDAHHVRMPDRYRGTVKEKLWIAFKSGARMPLCSRQLQNILV